METVGEKIKKIREAKGWSASKLGIESKLGQAYVSHIENGDVESPRFSTLRKIAEALGVELMDLVPREALPQGRKFVGIWEKYKNPPKGIKEPKASGLPDKEHAQSVCIESHVKEGEQEYIIREYPDLQRIDVHTQDEADSVHKLLLVLRGDNESAKISIKGFLNTLIGLVERRK